MTFALSTGSLGSWASPGTAASKAANTTAAVVVIAIRYELFTWKSPLRCEICGYGFSTILWTRRHDFPVRQRHYPQKSIARAVSGATCLRSNGLAEGALDVALVDVASPEKGRRRSFE